MNACPSTHYVYVNGDGTRECRMCAVQCQGCSGGADVCRMCAVGYFWESGASAGKCVQACPVGRPILTEKGC